MASKQLVLPRTGTVDFTGRCLPFAQTFFGARVQHDYARQAWDATRYKHGPSEPLPTDVAVLVWFDHVGRYFSHSKGIWETVNAGHVVAYVPGIGFYSSPAQQLYSGGRAVPGQEIYGSIREVEKAFNASYIGWSEDINGTRVAEVQAVSQEKEIKVKHYQRQDKDARGGGRILKPGKHLYLNTASGAASSASNIVGGIGLYSITGHVYAEGQPGDQFDIVLVWQDVKTKPQPRQSAHYTETITLGRDGRARISREFKRGVSAGFAVYLRVVAHEANAGDVKLTLIDSDAFLFTAA